MLIYLDDSEGASWFPKWLDPLKSENPTVRYVEAGLGFRLLLKIVIQFFALDLFIPYVICINNIYV